MKSIKFKRITLANFKAFRTFTMAFSDGVTNIFGRNESGKTTILDAIMWCLFNKDHLYRTTFALKTHDEQGNDIPKLEHFVELVIVVDGVERTLKRSLKEKWTKPRGQAETVFSGNYQECYVDGELVSSTNFSVFVGTFIEETVFKCITSPTYFLSLSWQEKRSFLQSLAGDISKEEITGGDSKFDGLISELEKQSIEEYTKHLKFLTREIKKKLDMIPVRIAEQEKALPQKQDWDSAEEKIKELQDYIDKVTERQKLPPEQRRRIDIDEKIRKMQKVQEERKSVIEVLYKGKVEEARNVYEKAQRELGSIQKDALPYQNAIIAANSSITENKAILQRCDKDTLDVRKKWAEVQNRKFSAPDVHVCPTCGQELPPEQIEKIIQKAKDDFNLKKADDLAALRKLAGEIKKQKIESEDIISSGEKTINQSVEVMNSFEARSKKLKEVKPYPDEVYLDMLRADDAYIDAGKAIEKLRAEYMEVADIDEPKGKTDETDEKIDLTKDKEEVKRLTAINQSVEVMNSFEARSKKLKEVKPYPDEVYLDMLRADDAYIDAGKAIEKLRAEYMEVADIDEPKGKTDETDEKIDLTKDKEEVKRLTALLAEKLQYEKGCSLIDGIKKENTDLAQQLADLERREDVTIEYSKRADNLLESRINKHFSLVKWKMFRTLVNGTREPYCECLFKGTEANDGLNSAGYIMAGIDICNAIAKFYQVSAPIIIDNAESINTENFIPSEGQQIRLFVSEEETLTIK